MIHGVEQGVRERDSGTLERVHSATQPTAWREGEGKSERPRVRIEVGGDLAQAPSMADKTKRS